MSLKIFNFATVIPMYNLTLLAECAGWFFFTLLNTRSTSALLWGYQCNIVSLFYEDLGCMPERLSEDLLFGL